MNRCPRRVKARKKDAHLRLGATDGSTGDPWIAGAAAIVRRVKARSSPIVVELLRSEEFYRR